MAPAEWGWLRSHAVAGRMVVVSRTLDLLEVGEAIAVDNTQLVKEWLDSGLLAVANQEEIDKRDRFPGKTEMMAAIVQPFVLVSELDTAPESDNTDCIGTYGERRARRAEIDWNVEMILKEGL